MNQEQILYIRRLVTAELEMVLDGDCNVAPQKATHLKDMLRFHNKLTIGLLCSA